MLATPKSVIENMPTRSDLNFTENELIFKLMERKDIPHREREAVKRKIRHAFAMFRDVRLKLEQANLQDQIKISQRNSTSPFP